ncbi:MAG: CDGSH iron-sulfur domain-containing protein [Holosporales bacterium]
MSDVICAQKGPYAVEVEAGKTYYWCTCGRSSNQPFCDGAHKGSGLKSQAWTAAESKTVYFCGCKASKDTPLCDGSHSAL